MVQPLLRGLMAVLLPTVLAATVAPAAAASGLGLVQVVLDGVAGVDGLNAARAIAMSPDGSSLYATGPDDDAIAAFHRDPATGRLTFLERERNDVNGVAGLDQAHGVAVSSDGVHVYVTGTRDDAVAVFRRNATNGRLTFIERQKDGLAGVTDLDGPEGLALSPDGHNVYVAAAGRDALVVFTRDADSGRLTFTEVQRDGVAGINGLEGAQGVAVSPDGGAVYVAAPEDKSVVVFQRHPGSGALTFLQRVHDGEGGVDGLDGARAVAFDRDGHQAYVAGKLDKSLVVFQRNVSGTLTFFERHQDTVAGVDGLDGVEAVTVSADGRLVYTAASDDNAVAVFSRDLATGALTFVGRQRDEVGTIDGLDGPRGLAVSPDGGSVYAAAGDAGAVVVFSTACGNGAAEGGEQCDDGNGVAGDGCSAGCRLECETSVECEDGDACTEPRCRNSECVRPRCGYTGALCELADSTPLMQSIPGCTGRGGRVLARTIRARLHAARQQLQQARRRGDKSARTVANRVRDLVARVTVKAEKLAARDRISPACLDAVSDAAASLTRTLPPIVQRRGLCPAS